MHAGGRVKCMLVEGLSTLILLALILLSVLVHPSCHCLVSFSSPARLAFVPYLETVGTTCFYDVLRAVLCNSSMVC